MNATTRWKEAYLKHIECVTCRTKENLNVYNLDGTLLDVTNVEDSELTDIVINCEVWCNNCAHVPSLRSRSEGRYIHKKEAAVMADLEVRRTTSSRNDVHLINGRKLTRQLLIDVFLENNVCYNCGGVATELVNFENSRKEDRGRRLSVVANFSGFSFDEFLKKLDKATILCYNCYNNQNFDRKALRTVVLDTEFWRLYDLKSNLN